MIKTNISSLRSILGSALLAASLILWSGLSYATVIPQAGWSLLYVDSEESGGWDAVNAFDNDPNTLWHTQFSGSSDSSHPHEIQIDLGSAYEIDAFRYLPRQDGGLNGTIRDYEFYVSVDGIDWGSPVATGTFAADTQEKEVPVPVVTGRFIRLVILSEIAGNPWASVAEINVLGTLFSGNLAPNGVIDLPTGNLSIPVGGTVNFTGTGTDPDNNLPLSYQWDFGGGAGNLVVEDPGSVQFDTVGTYVVAFIVTDALGLSDPTPATRTITVTDGTVSLIPQAGWSLLYVDSEQTPDHTAAMAFDGDVNTFWSTQTGGSATSHPHEIQIDLGALYELSAFRYLPRQDGGAIGRIEQYQFYVSLDGANWGNPVAFGSLADDPLEEEVSFPLVVAQFVRLVAWSEFDGKRQTSMAEFNLIGTPFSGNFAPDGMIDSPTGNLSILVGGTVNFTGTGTDPDNNLPLSY